MKRLRAKQLAKATGRAEAEPKAKAKTKVKAEDKANTKRPSKAEVRDSASSEAVPLVLGCSKCRWIA